MSETLRFAITRELTKLRAEVRAAKVRHATEYEKFMFSQWLEHKDDVQNDYIGRKTAADTFFSIYMEQTNKWIEKDVSQIENFCAGFAAHAGEVIKEIYSPFIPLGSKPRDIMKAKLKDSPKTVWEIVVAAVVTTHKV